MMKKSNEKGVYQLENGMWAYRFVITVDGKKINRRKTTDEFGNKLKTQKQALKARESAILHARLERERKKKISRKTMSEVYSEYCEKGRTDRAYQTIRKQDSIVFVGIVHPKGIALIVGAAIAVHLELIARIVDLHVVDLILRNANALDKLFHFN